MHYKLRCGNLKLISDMNIVKQKVYLINIIVLLKQNKYEFISAKFLAFFWLKNYQSKFQKSLRIKLIKLIKNQFSISFFIYLSRKSEKKKVI
ncbi:unnamed protein product [Paramecium sonneborni]|uniref:Uncharacterized protein n=1 Tax=Paramecium sonneborni TaxID=65129 RepID=A0A8S1RDM1_9CILI|nr:unnamed protein product [Paramecium sonneborni]